MVCHFADIAFEYAAVCVFFNNIVPRVYRRVAGKHNACAAEIHTHDRRAFITVFPLGVKGVKNGEFCRADAEYIALSELAQFIFENGKQAAEIRYDLYRPFIISLIE